MKDYSAYDAITEAMAQLQPYDYEPLLLRILLHPRDLKGIHVNKISIRFMQIIKRNRKLRNNKPKK